MGLAVERRVVDIPYVPRPQFLPFHYRKQRFGCMVAHRRAGKTVACINEGIKAALTCTLQDGRYAYIGPYYSQAKDVCWTYVKRYSAPVPGAETHEGELRVDYPNGARFRLYGADNYDRLRGGYFDGVILDEYADMSPAVWGEVVRPMLADRKGWAMFIGTPKGRNQFWEIWERAQKENWFTLQLKASESKILPQQELDEARKDMTPEQYEQEFECSFDAALLGAYYAQEIAEAERDGRFTILPDTDLPVHTAWDLGFHDNMAIWFFQVTPDGLRILDYYQNNGLQLEHYCQELKARPYTYGSHWFPHDARVNELVDSRTRIEFLQSRLGALNCKLVPSHRREDGINAARVSFKRMWFDVQRCRVGIEALRQYRRDFDDKIRNFKPEPAKGWQNHGADAFRYLALAWKEMKPSEITKPKPTDLAYLVNEKGHLVMNMTVKDWVEMQRRKRLNG